MRWGKNRRETDLERELQSHLELETQDQRENHLTPEQARYAARRAFAMPRSPWRQPARRGDSRGPKGYGRICAMAAEP